MTFHDPQRQDEASRIRAQLEAIEIERLRLVARLREIEREQKPSPPPSLAATVTNGSPAADKIALFRRLFAGRTDVFPARWENSKSGRSGYAPACANEWVRGVCGKPQVRCGECPNQSFIPVTDEVIEAHLRGEDRVRHNGRGDFVAGVYPLLFDDTCRFLAVDFDDESWSSDALAFLTTCRELGVPAALERSRSGNGGHVWLFFADAVPAFAARRLATMLLTRTMNRRPEIGFKSYDRLFPSQDTMPSGGFGNLIALPLQRRRARAATACSSTTSSSRFPINGRSCPRCIDFHRPKARQSWPRRRPICLAGSSASGFQSRMRTRTSRGK